ncbi:MAG: methionyl-tRNA synthetase [Peptococcaceae bacterium 1109]|nr:MAG: methionyl-tRNA synthetase [Peptococcaceae bacterium 1109]
MSNERFYISTPIYYPSDRLHIGHAYTTVVADSLARWHKFAGREVLFVTGSDEHGQKIERIAKAKGVQPQEYVDAIVSTFKQLWKRLNVDYDDFVRTTEPRHHKAVQTVFQKIYEKGDIYKSKYKGWYCTPCETFWVENKLHEGNCPDCGRPVELVEEESYFFKISKYANRLLKHIEENPGFIRPEARKNEMVNFIKSGLEDLCVSRTTFDWGIPVPTNEDHVIYVWFDALTNYLTAAGYPDDQGRLAKWWPADVHLVGKEIMRFHTIIWPIILMALDLPLPKTVFGHGWLLFDNDKMSKSKGNVVDPNLLIDEFGVDPIRYFLMREISFGQDGNFSRRALIERTNADLANDLGNLLNRTLAMLNKYFDGVVPEPQDKTELDLEYAKAAGEVGTAVDDYLKNLQLNEALAKIWQLVGRANKYLDQRAPWALAKDESAQGQLATVMYNVVETLRIVALLVKSFLPDTGAKIWAQLGIAESLAEQVLADTAFGKLKPGTVTQKGDPIFPRIEEKDEEPEVEAKEEPKEVKPAAEEKKPEPKQAEPTEGLISIDDFLKCELVVGEVLAAEPVKGADRLLKLQVDVGSDKRQIVAGIALHYKPEELVGRRIIVVKNLKPAKLRGELSQGMLLAASTPDGKLELVSVSDNMPAGSRVK